MDTPNDTDKSEHEPAVASAEERAAVTSRQKAEPEAEDPVTEASAADAHDTAGEDHPGSNQPTVTTLEQPAVPAESPAQPKKPRRKLWPFFAIIVIVIMNALIGGANFYLRSQTIAQAKTPVVANKITLPTSAAASTSQPKSQLTTLHYVSNALHVEFDYPVDWRIGGTADDKQLGLSSAPFNIPNGKTTATGTIELIIADPTSDGSGSYGAVFGLIHADDLIASDSEILPYVNPTAVQRKLTNISFASNQGNVPQGADFIFVSGNVAYKKGDSVGGRDLKLVSPHLYAYFSSCPDTYCHYFATATIPLSTWENNPNFAKLRNLIASLRFSQ